MEIKTITLPSEEEYLKYRSIISLMSDYWWLKTPSSYPNRCVRVVNHSGDLRNDSCNDSGIGVRPFCIFNLDAEDPVFWCKPEKLIGSKIRLGVYEWTVLDVEREELKVLCDNIITSHLFDSDTNVWEHSSLKQWLETEGLKLITA